VNAFDFIEYFWERRRFVLVAWGVAVALALGVSLLLPDQYKASCRIVIEAPAGSDPRVSTAISPIYLESLRTFEHFASGDSLFLRALDKFHLRDVYKHRSVESVKRSVLEVEIPRNTRILEIRATLPDARAAHNLALFIAEETVQLSRSVNQESDDDIARATERQYQEAKAKRDEADAEWSRASVRQPVDGLAADTEASQDLKNRLERQLSQEEVAAAEYADRAKALAQGRDASNAQEARNAALESRSAKVRADNLRARIQHLDLETRRSQSQLQQRTVQHEQLEARRKSAQIALEAAEARLREVRASTGYRGERLKIIDPGIVPERRSSPNVQLNVMLAWLLATVAATAYLAVEFSYRRNRAGAARFPLTSGRHRE
jgi:uncharacterized protein involved in exopolysaccharide biosynthesis